MDNIKPKVPIKVKIIISLTTIAFFAISLNLYFSVNIFTQDKKSYIFESALKQSTHIANRIIFPIQKIENNISYILNLKDKEQIKYYFEGVDNVVYFNRGNFHHLADINKTDLKAKELEKIFQYNQKTAMPIILGGQLFYLLRFPVQFYTTTILLSLEDIEKELRLNKTFTTFLLNNHNHPYQQKISPDMQQQFNQLLHEKFTQGTKEIKINKTSYLVSYLKSTHYNFNVVTLIKKDVAFEVIKVLTKKTIFFGMVLLGIAIFIGTLLAISLTKPINKLYAFTQKVGEGKYDSKVEVNTNDELKVLANSFNSMTSEISSLLKTKEEMIVELQLAKDQLEEYNKNLEKIVAQRTAELREAHNFMSAMINSLDQGLLVFNRDSICLDVYTKACEELFQQSPAGKHFATVIGNTSEQDIKTFNQWSDIVFSQKIPFDSAVGLAPQSIRHGESYTDDNYQVIDLKYFPMLDEQENINNVVVVATDKTEEARAKEQFINKEKYVEMVLKILQNKKHFLTFLKEIENIIHNIKNNLQAVKDGTIPFSAELFMIDFHTMNGGFGIYSAYTMQQLARKIEGELVEQKEMSKEENTKFLTQLEKYIEEFEQEYTNYLKECEVIFGEDLNNARNSITIEKSYVEELQYKLFADDKDAKVFFETYFINIPIKEHFVPYINLVENLQTKLGKQINPLKFIGADLRVKPNQYLDFYQSLVHLFRNCCDHGIETPDERTEKGKEAAGTILIETQQTANELIIKISDDGRGIDPQKIREKLKELDPDQSYDHIPDDKIIYQIFEPHFSTAAELTSVSGRGVGMSAIKEVVENYRGTIEVHSAINQGTTFVFILPRD